MKIECVKEKLSLALNKAEKITNKNGTLPVLACLYLEVKNQNLLIRATNLDCAVEIEIPVKVITPGEVAVPGLIFSSFVSSVKDKNIQLETKDGNLIVTTPHHKTTIKALAHDEFPTTPKISSKNFISLPAKLFLKGLRSVWYSASISSVKPELSSVYVSGSEQGLVFVSTDSFRLAEKKIKSKESEAIKTSLIPVKNAGDLMKVFDDSDEDVKVCVEKNQIAVSNRSIYFFSRLVDATFPDYEQIIPKNPTTEATLLKQDILDALKTITVFSDKFNQINVKVDPSRKTFIIQSKASDIGESVSSIDATVSGDPVDMNFNHRYISECLQSIDSDALVFNFNGPTKALVIKGVSDPSFRYLVMPMNK